MKKILVVDDDNIIRDLLDGLLSSDYEVMLKDSAESVLAYITSESNLDLMIVDYSMPGLNGLEFIEALQNKNINIPFILLTSTQDTDIIEKARSLNCLEYLDKRGGLLDIKKCVYKYLNKDKENLLKKHKISYKQDTFLDVANDYFDIKQIEDGFKLFIADDTNNASCANIFETSFNNHKETDESSKDFLTNLNKNLYNNGTDNKMATATLFSINLKDKTCNYTAASTPPLMHYSKATKQFNYHEIACYPLGLVEKIDFSSTRFNIQEGDILIAYTSGLLSLQKFNKETFQKHKITKEILENIFLQNIEEDIDNFIDKSWNDIVLDLNYKKQEDVLIVGVKI